MGDTIAPSLVMGVSLTDSGAMADTYQWTHPVTLTDSVAVGDADWIDLVGEKLKVTVVPDDPFTVTLTKTQPYVAVIDPSDPYKVELAPEDE
jgi:hypothetical protein